MSDQPLMNWPDLTLAQLDELRRWLEPHTRAVANQVASGGGRSSLDQIAGAFPTGANFSNSDYKIQHLGLATAGSDAANLTNVRTEIRALEWKTHVRLATAAALAANTYANGTLGVGATLTANANGALSIDGTTPAAGNRVLVKDEASGLKNGIYTVTTVGTGSVPYVLTRATDNDEAGDYTGGTAVYALSGTANTKTIWIVSTTGTFTLGTTAVVWTQFTGSGAITSIASAGGTVTVTGGSGPAVDLSVFTPTIEMLTLTGANLTVTSNSTGNFSWDYLSGSTLVDVSTPADPAILTAGFYALSLKVFVSAAPTPASRYARITIGSPSALAGSAMVIEGGASGSGAVFQLSFVDYLAAGQKLTVAVANDDSSSRTFGIDRYVIVRLS